MLPSILGASGNAPQVIRTANARAGQYAMKSQLSRASNVSYRTEVSLQKTVVNFDVGAEHWVGISIKLGSDFNSSTESGGVSNGQGMLFQWHYRNWLHPGAPTPPLFFTLTPSHSHTQWPMANGV